MLGVKFDIKIVDSSILIYRSSLFIKDQFIVLDFEDLSIRKVSKWGSAKSEFLETGVFQE